ncbi:TIGR03016 family PEP-CTERM system-associated outer membrane protein, partial [Rubrivivax gelatinosus]|nr:TIGR03016 family PEP-CTERM system-associated outer membrane protein [Rubrivivax gelatinosus]
QYARESGRSTTYNRLSADGAAELVPQHVFLDASASISQQSISAFGKQSSGTGIEDSNSTEVASVGISPSAKARLAGIFDVSALANWNTTRAKDSSVGDRSDWDTKVQIGATHGIFGWNVAGTRATNGYSGGDDYITENIGLALSMALTPRLQLFARHGEERSDVLGTGTQSSSTNGWGFSWQPSVRTQISAQSDNHFYGDSYSVSLSHRFRRSMLTYTGSRGVSGQDAEALGPLRAKYIRTYASCMATVNDASSCLMLTRLLLGFDPLASLGFLNSAPSLQRSQALALVVTGIRNTFTVAASSSESTRLGEQQYEGGDLAIVPRVRQYGLTMGLTHKLSRQMSLGVTGSAIKTLDEDTQPGNEQRRVELSLSNEFGPRTSGTLALRHVRFDSDTNPYRESALVGSLNYRF